MKRLLVGMVLLLLLACGNKGPLYLPSPAPEPVAIPTE
jgi:predicted small lipoprotein YifL